MKPWLRNKWLYTALLVLAALGWWWMSNSGKTKGPTAVRVTVQAASRQDFPVEVPLVGTVVAYETVSIKSRLDSQVVNVNFKDGDDVQEGQVLFTLDDRMLKAAIKQLEAGLAKEKAQAVNTRLQYERMQKLAKTSAVSQAQADEAKATNEAQTALVNAAQANLDNARVQLSYATITAPISGRTGTISVTRGNTVKANDTQPLVTINQISPIRVQFAVPQRYYGDVTGAMAKGILAVQARNKESSDIAGGTLEYIDNTIDVSNGTFAARAVFANEDKKLWPGMFVNVTLVLETLKGALTIPAVAVQGDEDNHFVFTVDPEQKKAIRTPVEITLNDGKTAVIGGGLSEGQTVVTDGLLRLNDGAKVEVAASLPEEGRDREGAPEKP